MNPGEHEKIKQELREILRQLRVLSIRGEALEEHLQESVLSKRKSTQTRKRNTEDNKSVHSKKVHELQTKVRNQSKEAHKEMLRVGDRVTIINT